MTGPVRKAASPRSLEGFLRTGYLIHDVSRLRRALYDQRSRHLGITRSQWWVLFNLSRGDGRPLNQNELAQMLEMGSASMGELLQRLEKSGFIERQVVPGDRRSKHVVIAERGREVLEHMRLVARSSNDAIMAGITIEEQQLLNGLLSKMKDNLLAEVAPESGGDVADGLQNESGTGVEARGALAPDRDAASIAARRRTARVRARASAAEASES